MLREIRIGLANQFYFENDPALTLLLLEDINQIGNYNSIFEAMTDFWPFLKKLQKLSTNVN